MIDWNSYPRCKAYLLAQRDRLDDSALTEYYAALNVASSFTEASLKAFGGVNFNAMKGDQLLKRMEEYLEFKPKRKVTPQKPKTPIDRIVKGISEDEIESARSPKGGWKRETLAGWGVPWPAPKGWRKKLIKNYIEEKDDKLPKGSNAQNERRAEKLCASNGKNPRRGSAQERAGMAVTSLCVAAHDGRFCRE